MKLDTGERWCASFGPNADPFIREATRFDHINQHQKKELTI